MKIGFIGVGFVGGNLASNFVARGYTDLVRYDLGEFKENKDKIKECDVVFISVPTPTTPKGFDASILFQVIKIPMEGSVVIVKSTVPAETLRELQTRRPGLTVMHSPEFLTENLAEYDTFFPERNIIGISDKDDAVLYDKARKILEILPVANSKFICSYEESALIKYMGNSFFYVKNVFINMMYDLAVKYGCDWEMMHAMLVCDSRIHPAHTRVVHKDGRGAGGHCLIKDFAALKRIYRKHLPGDCAGIAFFNVTERRNIKLLKKTKKDLSLLKGVYGPNV